MAVKCRFIVKCKFTAVLKHLLGILETTNFIWFGVQVHLLLPFPINSPIQFYILKLTSYFSISEIGDWNLHKALFPVLKELCFRQEQTWFSIIIKVESVYYFIDQSDWNIKEGIYCKDFPGGLFQLPKFCICRYGSRY